MTHVRGTVSTKIGSQPSLMEIDPLVNFGYGIRVIRFWGRSQRGGEKKKKNKKKDRGREKPSPALAVRRGGATTLGKTLVGSGEPGDQVADGRRRASTKLRQRGHPLTLCSGGIQAHPCLTETERTTTLDTGRAIIRGERRLIQAGKYGRRGS